MILKNLRKPTCLNVPFGAALGITLLFTAAGCAPKAPPAPRPAARIQPQEPVPVWFKQQLAAARAARQDHQPKADRQGAQRAYDDIMRAACTRAAVAGAGHFPASCNAILAPAPGQPTSDPYACEGNSDNAALLTECND